MGCSRGWSGGTAKRPDAEPVESGRGRNHWCSSSLSRPGGAKETPERPNRRPCPAVPPPPRGGKKRLGPAASRPFPRLCASPALRRAAVALAKAATSRGPDGAEKPRRATARPMPAVPPCLQLPPTPFGLWRAAIAVAQAAARTRRVGEIRYGRSPQHLAAPVPEAAGRGGTLTGVSPNRSTLVVAPWRFPTMSWSIERTEKRTTPSTSADS